MFAIILFLRGVNDNPQSGWLVFYRHRRQNTGAPNAPIIEKNAVKPGALHPVWKTQSKNTPTQCGHIKFSVCR
jgi:hypothetical protein